MTDEPAMITAEQLDRLVTATNRLASVAGNTSTSGVHIHSGGWVAMLVALIGVISIMHSMHGRELDATRRAAELDILSAERKADMAVLNSIRADLEQQGAQLRTDRLLIGRIEQRLTNLEPKP